MLAVAALALLGAAIGWGVFWWTSRPATPREPIAVSIGRASFHIPPALVRSGALPRPGAQERVDLAMRFPDMAPAAPTETATTIFVALLREDGAVDPAQRVTEIYGRFLEPDIWGNPGGLLLRRFTADSPYHDEELFISPPEGREFSARCRKPSAVQMIGEMCVWRYRDAGIDVQVRFAPELLPQWETLAAGVRAKVAEWRR